MFTMTTKTQRKIYFCFILLRPLSLFAVIPRYDLFISNLIKSLSNFIDAIADDFGN